MHNWLSLSSWGALYISRPGFKPEILLNAHVTGYKSAGSLI